jgi:hypothetical protein
MKRGKRWVSFQSKRERNGYSMIRAYYIYTDLV